MSNSPQMSSPRHLSSHVTYTQHVSHQYRPLTLQNHNGSEGPPRTRTPLVALRSMSVFEGPGSLPSSQHKVPAHPRKPSVFLGPGQRPHYTSHLVLSVVATDTTRGHRCPLTGNTNRRGSTVEPPVWTPVQTHGLQQAQENTRAGEHFVTVPWCGDTESLHGTLHQACVAQP